MMAYHQIGRELDGEDVSLFAAWLSSLTGELPPVRESASTPRAQTRP